MVASAYCLLLLRQLVWRADSRALAKTGKRMAARIAIIAITTSNSIRVNPVRRATSLALMMTPPGFGSDSSKCGQIPMTPARRLSNAPPCELKRQRERAVMQAYSGGRANLLDLGSTIITAFRFTE